MTWGTPGRPGRPTHLDRPTSTDLVAPSRSTSCSSRPESPRVARPSRSARQNSIEKGARDAPRGDFRPFRVNFRVDFRGFSRLHRASDSTRVAMGQTSVFAGRRSTSEGSLTLRKNRKSMKVVEKSLRRRCANEPREENSIFSFPDASWRQFRSTRRAPGRSRAPLLASRGALGDPPGVPGARRGHPERLPGPILNRF